VSSTDQLAPDHLYYSMLCKIPESTDPIYTSKDA